MSHVLRWLFAATLALVVSALATAFVLLPRPDAGEPPAPAAAPRGPSMPAIGGPEPGPFDSSALRAPPVSGTPDILIHGSGWGHGVGMSQYGAQAQALAGRSHADILAYYYPGTRLERAAEETEQIRVNLFLNRADLDRSRLHLRTSSRDGGAPDRPVEVELGDEQPVELPWPQTWTLSADRATGELVLTDNRGEERRRGDGPARVRYEFHDGNATLLRVPQLVPRNSSTRLSGTFAWGELEVHHAGGRLQPVAVLPLERYLYGIAEVPSRWETAALGAQAVAARTYAVRQMREPLGGTCRCHLGATPHHQVYIGYAKEGVEVGDRWREAVNTTVGEVLTHQGALAWTYYSSSHGGRSEQSEESWAYAQAFPYLRSVDDPWSLDPAVDNPYATWTRRIDNAELADLVGRGLAQVHGVRVLDRTAGNSPRTLELRGVDADGDDLRVRWDGGDAGSAATALKRHFGARLPSQQIAAIGLEPFVDDAGLRGEYEIVAAHRAGLLRGCDEGRRLVCPDDPVSRGEFAVALVRGSAGADDALTDLEAALGAHDEEEAVAEAVAAGLLANCRGGCTEAPVTRADAAVAFGDALGLDGVLPEDAEAAGPDDPLTRHDLAVALSRAFDLD